MSTSIQAMQEFLEDEHELIVAADVDGLAAMGERRRLVLGQLIADETAHDHELRPLVRFAQSNLRLLRVLVDALEGKVS